jgi:hypothetical protein
VFEGAWGHGWRRLAAHFRDPGLLLGHSSALALSRGAR